MPGKKRNKQPAAGKPITNIKDPISKERPESYVNKNPVWSFSRYDSEGRWTFDKARNFNKIVKKLKDFEGMEWQRIMSQTKDSGDGSANHLIEVADLTKEAQKRLLKLGVVIDQIFSLRLNNLERIFGVLEDSTLYIIWYDSAHEICPSRPRNT